MEAVDEVGGDITEDADVEVEIAGVAVVAAADETEDVDGTKVAVVGAEGVMDADVNELTTVGTTDAEFAVEAAERSAISTVRRFRSNEWRHKREYKQMLGHIQLQSNQDLSGF